MKLQLNKDELTRMLPSFLMGLGGAFSLKATVDGVRSTFKVTEDGYERGYFLSKEVQVKDKLNVIGKYYWPVGIEIGLATGCFVGAMCGYEAQIASATAVASYFEKQHHDYRQKTKELYGTEADEKIQTEVVKDQVDQNPPPKQINEYAYRIYDPVTDQWFEATPDEINHCNDGMNHILGKEGPVVYNYMLQFFRGVSHTKPFGYDIGWFLDESYIEYHYYNESFFGRPHFKINLEKQESAEYGVYYILRCSLEPMLNLELDADVVKDSQDVHGL